MIKQNGGSVAAKVTDACTHLVTTQKDFMAQSSKGDNIRLLSLKWSGDGLLISQFDVLLYPHLTIAEIASLSRSIHCCISPSLRYLSFAMASDCPQLDVMQLSSSRISSHLSLLHVRTSSTLTILYTTDWVVIVISAVAQAQKLPDIKIVSLDWLLDSVNEGKVFDEAHYSFTDPNTDKSAPSPQPAMRLKRARAATPEKNDTQQIATSNPKEARVPHTKRQKDGQKAKSGSALTVSVDEGCNLASKDLVHYHSQSFLQLTG